MKRTSISLPDDLEKWLDEEIRKRKFHNYQHAIEYCLNHVKEHKKDS